MKERGVLYIVWGNQIDVTLERSIASLARTHPELAVEVVRGKAEGGQKDLLRKAKMFTLSPFRETLFLDANTVVLGRLDYGFERAQRFGLACCICECP